MGTKVCKVKVCDRPVHARGLCAAHLKRQDAGKPLGGRITPRGGPERVCLVEGCTTITRSYHGFCDAHRHRAATNDTRPARDIAERECAFPACDRIARTKGYCTGHYQQHRTSGELRPLKVPSGRYINSNGYALVYKPDDPSTTKNGWVMEHRWVMAEHLGRPLYPDENVHHINGVRDDNRLENLELWSSSQPSGQRVEDKLAWARQILERYER